MPGGPMTPGPGPKGGGPKGGTSGGATGGSTSMTCTPGNPGTFISDCGYPQSSTSPLTSVDFNESEVLRALKASNNGRAGVVKLLYNDEHALTLGVRQVVVKSANGSGTTNYAVSALPTVPAYVKDPATGTNILSGDQSGLDPSARPMWPVLFVTDVTAKPESRVGDWQYGGRPYNPQEVYGTWKSAVRTVDKTVSPSKVTITPDADPAKNDWNLAGGDPIPSGFDNEGYGAEVVWNVPLEPAHSYRIQVMVHDGDQNKVGGDSGEACVLFCAGGGPPEGGTGGGPPPPSCPAESPPCESDGIDPATCQAGATCVAGCCIFIPTPG